MSVAGDCDDLDALVSPGELPWCDGRDHDCDGLTDSDADGDGFADGVCGGNDCDDANSSLYPGSPSGNGCSGEGSCVEILDAGGDIGDGFYTIDPDGTGIGNDPFDVYCDMTGGGWTRLLDEDFEDPLLIDPDWDTTASSVCNGNGLLGDVCGQYGFEGTFPISKTVAHTTSTVTLGVGALQGPSGTPIEFGIGDASIWIR